MIVQDYISKWIWIFRPYGGANKGVWCLPDINDQVMIAFIGGDVNQPVCIGGMYTPRHRPPIKDNKKNCIKAIKTKGTYCLIDDTAGKERIEASVKDGKIRAVIDKDGIHLTNELGDIALKCKTMSVKSESSSWDIKKDVTIKTGGDLTIKTSKTFGITAKKDITIKGKSIDLKGSTGVTAENKQLSVENDPVAGMDLHDIMVPSNSGLTKVPAIPHPYIGKLNDKLSDDVTVGGKAAATKGSKSEFGTPGHFPMPPGVKFAKKPNNKGEVTNGCIDSVTINGNAAAVIGSTVTTCDDLGQKDQCTIISIGTVVTFPIQYPGQDPEQYRRDSGLPIRVDKPAIYTAAQVAEEQTPKSITNLQWSSSKVNKGEEAELTIKSFEMSDKSPSIKMELWEDDLFFDDFAKCIDITIDTDEKTVKVPLDIDLNKISDFNTDDEYKIYGLLLSDDKKFKTPLFELNADI
jgi:phage baseplate assembly protein gpV/uncharacterized Zn-binding protein involved in type VI secretion